MPPAAEALAFRVRRADLRQTALAREPLPPVAPGQVRLAVDRFGLTANNVTYAVFGDAMQYWSFFPAPEGWGCVPVWGFATVAESRHDGIREGERLFGYLPMSTQLVVQPDRVTGGSFLDASPHRRPLPSAYQLYRRCDGDPAYRADHEDLQALLFPLFVTSWLIEDFLVEQQAFGARRVVLASASSKTALGVAQRLSRSRPNGAEVVALTSAGNRAFCERLGCYDRVLAYEALAQLPREPAVYVDMAGDGRLLHDVHHHLGDALKHSCIVGATHWRERATQHALPGPKPQFFFAPARYGKRLKDWGAAGPDGVEARFARAWAAFVPWAQPWLQVEHGRGPEAVTAAWTRLLEGRVPPDRAHMLSL